MKQIVLAMGVLAMAGSASAQKKDKNKPAGGKEVIAAMDAAGFSKTENGIEYKIVDDKPGTVMAQVGDHVELVIETKIGDSVLFSSNQMNNNQPVQFQLQPPNFKGDLVEGLMMMSQGDSAVLRMSVDSLIAAGTPKQPWMKEGENQKLVYNIRMVSLKSQAQMEQEQKAQAAKQIGIDEKILQDYFKNNNISPKKTESGLYYTIDRAGTGENVKAGQKVTVNYTGKFLDGKPFDSNVDPQFSHVQPFSFNVGQGMVIPGWDEGLQLMKKGTKGTLYIPSTLAYGSRAQGPIQPNSILMFDIEVTDIE